MKYLYLLRCRKCVWSILSIMMPIALFSQSNSHVEASIMLTLPTGEYRTSENDNRAEPGFGFRLEYFQPIGKKGFGVNPAFSGVFNKNVQFKPANTRFFKVTGGWYSHLILGVGPAYFNQFRKFGMKVYANAGLNFTSISDSEETIINTGQIIETYAFENSSNFCYEAGFSVILEKRVVLGISYINLGNLDYRVTYNQVNNEPEQQQIKFTGHSINFKLGMLF
jgi:hypothetical protein